MKKANSEYSIKELCQLFTLSSSTYYEQTRTKLVSAEHINLIAAIKRIAKDTGDTYGKRRMKPELHKQGFTLGLYRTASMMKKAEVIAITPKKKHYYPDGGKSNIKANNLLSRQFEPGTLNTHWVGDITYIPTYEGWSYLACVLDLGSKEIIGWSMSKHPTAELALDALKNAIKRQQPDMSKLMFHSDQGVQYSAGLFSDYLQDTHITQSMSRRGNCWDNAVMERFFRSLKSERLNHLKFINHYSAVSTVDSYIRFYNYKRLHSAIGYITPTQKAVELKKAA